MFTIIISFNSSINLLPLVSLNFPFLEDYHDTLALQRINSYLLIVTTQYLQLHLKPQPELFYITKADVTSSKQRSLSLWSFGLMHSQLLTFLCDCFVPSLFFILFSTHEAYICSSINYELNPLLFQITLTLPNPWGLSMLTVWILVSLF